MFGHLDLNLDDDRLFQACRCGLCHALAKDYGIKARLLTNDDLTLCLWLILSFSSSPPPIRKSLCPLLVRRRTLVPETPLLRFAAAATILLAWEKYIDDEHDEKRSFPAKARKRFERMRDKAEAVFTELGGAPTLMSTAFNQQRELERMATGDLTEYATATGTVLGHLYRQAASLAGLQDYAEGFDTIGQSLGKIIYCLDSVVDYRRDASHDAFNPLILSCGSSHRPPSVLSGSAVEGVRVLLNHLRAIIVETLSVLPHHDLIREALVDRLETCLVKTLAGATSPQPEAAVQRCSEMSWQAGMMIFGCPKSAVAADGRISTDQCAGNIVLLVLMFFAYCAICRGCRNSCACGHKQRSSDRVTVDDGCGGQRTYKRDSCSGRYRSNDSGCC